TIDMDKGNMHRPIPRDRDQAFFVNEGVVPTLFSRRWALPKFEGFDEEIDWPPGLAYNARHFDRSFLNELTEDDWVREAAKLRALYRSEEHTSELQSRENLVCRLLLEKKKEKNTTNDT